MEEEDVDDPMEIDDTVPNNSLIIERLDGEIDTGTKKSESPQLKVQHIQIDGSALKSSIDSKTDLKKVKPKKPMKKAHGVIVLDDDEMQGAPSAESNNTNSKFQTEVIDLVPRSVFNTKCLNYSCKSGKYLMRAPGFCISYYRIKCASNAKKEVCRECYDMAVADYNKLVTEFKAGNLLCNVDVPLRNDMVEIDDSDEEGEEIEEGIDYLDDESAKFIANEIDDVFNGILAKHNIVTQAKNELRAMKLKNQDIGKQMQKVDAKYKTLRSTLDTLQFSLYKKFKPDIQEMKGINIIDVAAQQVTDLHLTSPDKQPVIKNNNVNAPITSQAKLPEPVKITPKTEIKVKEMPTTPPKESVQIPPPNELPKIGLIDKPAITIGETYYIARTTENGPWIRARLLEIIPADSPHLKSTMYKLVELKQLNHRQVSGKQIAYSTYSTTRLEVGIRVLAAFKEGQNKKTRNAPYYPGVVAEPPLSSNNYRYLIFFDIGYSQYVPFTQVNLIYESSANVWEDMSVDCQGFIKKYLESGDHPMIKAAKEQTIRTEYKGRWYLCTVMDVDCSLVQVYFESLNRMEWIYRGSTRLSPIFREEQAASNRQTGARPVQRKINYNESNTIVQYTRNTETVQKSPPDVTITPTSTVPSRAVARKSTTMPPLNAVPAVPFLPPKSISPANLTGPTSKIMYFTPRDQVVIKRSYKPHTCSPKCKEYLTHNFNRLRGHNPLSKPLLCGWARLTVKVRGRKEIIYKAPCGRMLRNMCDIHYYLSVTRSEMTVDLFDLNHMVRCLAEFSVDCVPHSKDLSNGMEQVPIPVVNGINNEVLDFCNYSTKRLPTDGVNMNLDPEFLCGCDCENDCIDKLNCACWKLTLEGAGHVSKDVDGDVGYIYKRLNDQVLTGIYECNSRCKCSSTCLNRVVQYPLSLKLQVFKTHNRGWGIRALNDVPKGAFVCTYAGSIHTEQMANEDGIAYGDEYFAELDYIESVEKAKEDYESDVSMSDEEETVPERTIDNNFLPSYVDKSGLESAKRRKQIDDKNLKQQTFTSTVKKEVPREIDTIIGDIDTVTISDDEDEGREVLSFNPKSGTNPDNKRGSKYISVRELFGPDENVYVMDAKSSGNIGRFLNHSCSPNVFVQNVFVDTHDPRFPWVAFFSSQFIRAGTELVWNYNYDVGSVPGRVLYCYCSSLECKGRLL